MTEEQIKQKAEAEADKVIIGSRMDRTSVIHLKHLLVTMYMQGATEATKELQKQIQIDAEQIRALQKQNGELTDELTKKSDTNHQLVEQMAELNEKCSELKAQIAELRKIAEFQQFSNMSRHFENKKLKEGLTVGSTFNKALNSMNKNLEEERDKYRNMVFDKDDNLTKAKDILRMIVYWKSDKKELLNFINKAEQFLNEVEK